MPDTVRAPQLPQTAAFGPNDYVMIIRGSTGGPLSGPLLLPASALVVTGGTGGGDDEGEPTFVPVTRVFGRIGDIVAALHDYSADLVDYDGAVSGLAASTVQDAIDAVAALAGNLPTPTSEGHFLGLDGSLDPVWMAQSVVSVFGRDGVVEIQAGDITADLITDNDGFVIMTDAERTKLTALDTARQLLAGGTAGQVLSKIDGDDYNVEWATPAAGPGGGSLSQIDLFARCFPSASAPPTYKYVAGTGIWSFSQSGSDEIRGQFRWPGGAATVKVQFISETATTGNGAWTFDLMAMTPADAAAIQTDSFATSNVSDTVAVPGTVGHPVEASIDVTNDDGVATGDYVRWRLKRKTDVGSNAAGALAVHTATILFA